VTFFVTGVRFFFVEGNQHWGGENYHDALESGTIFGANKRKKEIFS
jgi:hypothetical protein